MANWGRIASRGSVEDRRGFAPVAGGLSLTGLALVFLFNYLAGGNVTDVLQQLDTLPIQQQQTVNTEQFAGEDTYEVFASTVLGSNNELWAETLSKNNQTYVPPKLVLFRTATESSCGVASSQVGPHYCPLDKTIYLDETFFDELTTRFGAKGGDVAEAYVIAHEVGHHVQNQLGLLDTVHTSRSMGEDANQAAVKVELQADCFAGMWAHSIKHFDVFTPGEIHEAMDAAAAVGDDRIQKQVTGYVNPERWTHGSSADRVKWFNKGYESGSFDGCDTLNPSE